jgi:hypothetical protein
MKRVGTFAAIAFGSAAVLAAQGPGQTTPQPGRSGGSTDTRPAQSSESGTVTLTGCLQRADGSSTGAGSSSASGASASGASATGASFILTDASMGSGSGSSASGSTGAGAAGTTGSSAAGAAGTSGSSAAGRSGSTYMLDGSASELSSHVNKRVQVTGTMASGSSSGAGSSGAATSGAGTPGAGAGSSGAGASASGSSSRQQFKVTSVKEVGGDCSASSSSPR